MRTGSVNRLGHFPSDKWRPGEVLLDPSIARGSVDWAAMFGNDHPVELEIGSGKGTFLLARAAARPEVNFLGIEYAGAYCRYAADRMRRHGLGNVRMLCTDAGAFFKRCVPRASLLRLHVYFPDPWPKRKHHRRRLIQPAFVERARRSLCVGGQLVLVTDHLDYFRWMCGVLAWAEGWIPVPMPRMADREGEIVGTNFERKYIAQGRPFYSRALLRYL